MQPQVAEMRRKKNGSFKFNITVNNCHLENKSDWLSWRRLAIHFSSGSLYQFRAKTTARAQAVESQEKTIWMSRHSASPTHTHTHTHPLPTFTLFGTSTKSSFAYSLFIQSTECNFFFLVDRHIHWIVFVLNAWRWNLRIFYFNLPCYST